MPRQALYIETSVPEEELRAFMVRRADLVLAPYYAVAPDRLTAHGVRSLLADSVTLFCRRGGELCGAAAFSRARLECEIYRIEMGELHWLIADGDYADSFETYVALLKAVRSAAREHGLVHLSCGVPAEDVSARHALEAAGFRLMDSRVEYAWRPQFVEAERKPYGYALNAASEPGAAATAGRLVSLGARVRPIESTDIPALRAIAAEAFTQRTHTRYTNDPALPLEDTARLYAQWLENAANGLFGDVTVVAEVERVPVGFQSLRIERELSKSVERTVGAMGIGAVAVDARGTGVFPILLVEILMWCRAQGVDFARGGVLINNYPMHRCHIATGASLVGSRHSFHAFWTG